MNNKIGFFLLYWASFIGAILNYFVFDDPDKAITLLILSVVSKIGYKVCKLEEKL